MPVTCVFKEGAAGWDLGKTNDSLVPELPPYGMALSENGLPSASRTTCIRKDFDF